MNRVSNSRMMLMALAMVSAIVFASGCAMAGEKAGVNEISQQELISSPPENVLVLDVRSTREFEGGHVPNAVNIPHTELASRLAELEAESDRPIVVYCRSGHRAGLATSVLQEAGYTDLHHLTGDMMGWTAEGLPTE